MARLRLGIILIIVSWLPIAQVMLYVAHNNQQLTSEHSSSEFRAVVWAIQIVIGFVGLWLAGKVALAETKKDGWRHTPGHIWHLFWQSPEES